MGQALASGAPVARRSPGTRAASPLPSCARCVPNREERGELHSFPPGSGGLPDAHPRPWAPWQEQEGQMQAEQALPIARGKKS